MCERTKVWPSQLQQQCSLNFCLDRRLISQLHSSSTEGKKHFLNAIHHEESKWTDLCVISSTVITHSFRFRGLQIELVLLCIRNNRISEQLQGYNLPKEFCDSRQRAHSKYSGKQDSLSHFQTIEEVAYNLIRQKQPLHFSIMRLDWCWFAQETNKTSKRLQRHKQPKGFCDWRQKGHSEVFKKTRFNAPFTNN